jgi:hypothetical protein
MGGVIPENGTEGPLLSKYSPSKMSGKKKARYQKFLTAKFDQSETQFDLNSSRKKCEYTHVQTNLSPEKLSKNEKADNYKPSKRNCNTTKSFNTMRNADSNSYAVIMPAKKKHSMS